MLEWQGLAVTLANACVIGVQRAAEPELGGEEATRSTRLTRRRRAKSTNKIPSPGRGLVGTGIKQ